MWWMVVEFIIIYLSETIDVCHINIVTTFSTIFEIILMRGGMDKSIDLGHLF